MKKTILAINVIVMSLMAGCSSPPKMAAISVLESTTNKPSNSVTKHDLEGFSTLIANGEIESSREFLGTKFNESGDIWWLEYWMEQDVGVFEHLQHTTPARKRLTTYERVDYKNTTINEEDEEEIKKWVQENCVSPAAWPGIYQTGRWMFKNNAKRIKFIEQDPQVDYISMGEAKAILAKCDALRNSQRMLHGFIRKSVIATDPIVTKHADGMLKKYSALKSALVAYRTDYLSYVYMSPYLAAADQLIYHSEIGGDRIVFKVSHDEVLLRNGAKVMAKGCSNELLLEVDESVRDQFFQVLKRLKAVAGKAELEEIKVVQQIADSLSDKNVKGGEKWWLKE